MKAKYDSEVDSLTLNWSDQEIEESESISAGVILDYDQAGNVIGIEILNASQKIENLPVQPARTPKKEPQSLH